jgi:protein KRI1
LLYPSEALQALEKERQQLNELLASSQSKDRSTSESNEELLARLQASLKKKEEEYYQLHREAAADSGPAFRYREVEPEDFTLSIEEILALDDRQLNMIAPMNCYAAYLDKESNERDRRRIERRRQKGFREIASDRTSRRYGDVASTALLNPEQINAEEGAAIAANLAKRLREEGEDPDAPPAERAASRRQMKGPRREEGDHLGRGGRGVGRGEHFRGRGGVRGGFRGPHRGGGDRGRGGFRGGR